MKIWFTSDLHFGHENILKHFSVRNFANIKEHDDHIVDQINKYVGPKDILWNLGDFCWTNKPGHYRERLKCKQIHFCWGNHDKAKCKNLFSTCQDTKMLKVDGHEIFMSHYPHAYWNHSHHGAIHIYGHLHYYRDALMDEMMPGRRAMDVGIDAAFHKFGEYRPFTLEEVLALAERPGHHDLQHEEDMEEKWGSGNLD